MMKENNKINTKGNWLINARHLRTNFDPDNPATSSNRRIRKAMAAKGLDVIQTLIMTIVESDLDLLKVDNLTGALGLLFRIIKDRRYTGTATKHFPGLLTAITTDPEGTARQLIDFQSQYWVDAERDQRRLEPLRAACLNDRTIVLFIETISSITGSPILNKLVKNQGLMIVRK
ncbi:hypothetical protein OLL83_001062 [Shewanella algae]|uniref:hypothetical protein n=1 Tax=Shewanella algae TaxID=38313 RepID=UPI00222FECB4|nr:hypothetical protein [Shewanella algae]UZD59526.1 hypothetical protein OLL83_001062 [Shewanella algae]